MISPCTRPAAANFANPWIIGVCGVIGYTGTTSGSIWRIASATASPPVSTRGATVLVAIAHHPDRVDGADGFAELAALADVVIEAEKGRPLEPNGRIRTVEPAEQAVDAAREIDLGLQTGPPGAGPRLLCVARAH